MNEIRTVGRYEVVRVLGRGGMAVVYLARQTDLDRFVALKELSRVGMAEDPTFAQRFIRESKLAGSFAHPNIVVVHEYFEYEGTPYIAMEYVPGGSLRPYVGTLSIAQIGGVLEGILAGLAHAEQFGVVHRDLKPENLMVTEEGRVKITDFGIARATTSAATKFVTATGTTVGTPAYMAPEQAMGRDIGPWTDLYTTGVITYELLSGRLPFPQDEAPMALLMRHINEDPPPLQELRPDLSPALTSMVMDLLRKDPKQRPGVAESTWHQLEDVLITVLGPRWRRSARLPSEPGTKVGYRPLTPAPFDSKRTPTPRPGPAAAPATEGASQYFSFPQEGSEPTPPPALPPEPEAPATPAETQPVAAAGPEPTPPAEPPAGLRDEATMMPGTTPPEVAPAERTQPAAPPSEASQPAAPATPGTQESVTPGTQELAAEPPPPGPATHAQQEVPPEPPPARGGRRRSGAVAVLVVAALAAAGVAFVVLGGDDESGEPTTNGQETDPTDQGDRGDGGEGQRIEFEPFTPGPYEIEAPAGWQLVENEVEINPGHFRTRVLEPGGDVMLGLNHFPSEGFTPSEYVDKLEQKKLTGPGTDPAYVLHERADVEIPAGRQAAYWDFDVDHEVLGPSRAFVYIFQFGDELYRVQGSAQEGSGRDDVAAEIAEHGAETLEVG